MTVENELRSVLMEPTGTSSSGYPYLPEHAWLRLRDWVPVHLGSGAETWARLEALERELGPEVADAARVVRQVLNTAQVTAPPDLWLMRYVVSALRRVGVVDALLGDGLLLSEVDGLDPAELSIDLTFLLSRGIVVRRGPAWQVAEGPSARSVLALPALPDAWPTDLPERWAAAARGETGDVKLLSQICVIESEREARRPPVWVATAEDVALGWRLVPLVIGLRAAGRLADLLAAGRVDPEGLKPLDPGLAKQVCALLCAAGCIDENGALLRPGSRVLRRGPGPFGIIGAYHPYMGALPRILRQGRGSVHVARGANVAASQDANRRAFYAANDALDRYCADSGFAYSVFIEHAVGHGEAIRQRWGRSGEGLSYVGADLEPEALQAAADQRALGRLPADLLLVQADVGEPAALVAALRAKGLDPTGAVMVVGNGFHEVRDQTDARMVEVFRGYREAQIVLLFTEESALAIDDLLHTAWNTYHSGFRYVHERSGQGLRPAGPQPPSRLGQPLPASWSECAERAGYRRLDAYCHRSRTIYPHPPPSGVNPAISTTHFLVP